MKRRMQWVILLVLFWRLGAAAENAAATAAPATASAAAPATAATASSAAAAVEDGSGTESAPLSFREWFEALPPDEQRELQDLRDRDPAAFRAALRKRLPAPLLARFEERQVILALAERYRQASPEEQPAIKKELEERLTKHYYSRLERNGKRLKDARQQLDELEKDFAERSSNADEIIQAELTRLLSSPPQTDVSTE